MGTLYILSKLNGYGTFLVENCTQDVMEVLAENLLQAGQWFSAEGADPAADLENIAVICGDFYNFLALMNNIFADEV